MHMPSSSYLSVLTRRLQDNLDPRTVFDLLASHGRDEMTLYYASVVGDHERIVTYWILEEGWTEALQALSKQVSRLALSFSQLD